ncbi:hypothetical protein C8R44DRAFT_753093 [Mycena epipterygia]|nr:hypothetical protein C8R44DRAFT_753093 [Mycena epipterygia]
MPFLTSTQMRIDIISTTTQEDSALGRRKSLQKDPSPREAGTCEFGGPGAQRSRTARSGRARSAAGRSIHEGCGQNGTRRQARRVARPGCMVMMPPRPIRGPVEGVERRKAMTPELCLYRAPEEPQQGGDIGGRKKEKSARSTCLMRHHWPNKASSFLPPLALSTSNTRRMHHYHLLSFQRREFVRPAVKILPLLSGCSSPGRKNVISGAHYANPPCAVQRGDRAPKTCVDSDIDTLKWKYLTDFW